MGLSGCIIPAYSGIIQPNAEYGQLFRTSSDYSGITLITRVPFFAETINCDSSCTLVCIQSVVKIVYEGFCYFF